MTSPPKKETNSAFWSALLIPSASSLFPASPSLLSLYPLSLYLISLCPISTSSLPSPLSPLSPLSLSLLSLSTSTSYSLPFPLRLPYSVRFSSAFPPLRLLLTVMAPLVGGALVCASIPRRLCCNGCLVFRCNGCLLCRNRCLLETLPCQKRKMNDQREHVERCVISTDMTSWINTNVTSYAMCDKRGVLRIAVCLVRVPSTCSPVFSIFDDRYKRKTRD